MTNNDNKNQDYSVKFKGLILIFTHKIYLSINLQI